MKRRVAIILAAVSTVLACALVSVGAEKLDRGLIALQRDDGSVFLSWRLLRDDPPDVTFRVCRRRPGDTVALLLTDKGPYRQTCLVDPKPDPRPCVYELFGGEPPGFDPDGGTPAAAVRGQVSDSPKPYLSIRLGGDDGFPQVGVGDLDGRTPALIMQRGTYDRYRMGGAAQTSGCYYPAQPGKQD